MGWAEDYENYVHTDSLLNFVPDGGYFFGKHTKKRKKRIQHRIDVYNKIMPIYQNTNATYKLGIPFEVLDFKLKHYANKDAFATHGLSTREKLE